MQKTKIYISSRSNNISKGLEKVIKLSDLRLYLRSELEKEQFLGEEMLEVIIHENNFAPDGSENAHTKSITKLKTSNIIIILYNGEAGWNPANESNGICHDEYLTATQYFAPMMHIMDVSSIFGINDKRKLAKKDQNFMNNINNDNLIREAINASTVDELYLSVLSHIKTFILSDVEKSFETQKDYAKKSAGFGETLKYSQMTYEERRTSMVEKLEKIIPSIFPDAICHLDAIPDNMSVADARILIGRPYLHELDYIKHKKKIAGVIHIIAVYGYASELQVKNLIGFPDLAVVKTVFGFYIWDTTNQIQMVFLVKNINSGAIGSNTNALKLWVDTSGEKDNIYERAKARFSILKAIEKAKKVIEK